MIRISTIFVGISMVLIAASLGIALYGAGGVSGANAFIVALTALSFLILYNAVSLRLRDRTDVSSQIADLSRGTGDLARQVSDFGRRLAAAEARIGAALTETPGRVEHLAGEINELGALVRQIAVSVAHHDEVLNAISAPAIAASAPLDAVAQSSVPPPPTVAPAQMSAEPAPAAAPARADSPPPAPDATFVAMVKAAVADNRIDLYLQPLVTLPQRKVRYYEAVSRLRDDKDQLIAAHDFIAVAEQAGVMPRIDQMVMFRCIQVLRRLTVRNKDVGMFCNVAAATLRDGEVFGQCLDFLDANRALAPSFVLEFKQDTFRHLGPVESENLAALAQRGFRFSIDNVTDLRIEPRELADRGVRFVKVPAHLLLDTNRTALAEIHPADLSDLLGRFGIDLVAERIEGERAVVDLLDYDVRYGQGFLFAPPRPLRPEAAGDAPATSGSATSGAAPAAPSSPATPADAAKPAAPARAQGVAALARRISSN